MDKNYGAVTFFRNSSTLTKRRVANFADVIKIANILIKATFKDKIIRIYALRYNLNLYFLI